MGSYFSVSRMAAVGCYIIHYTADIRDAYVRSRVKFRVIIARILSLLLGAAATRENRRRARPPSSAAASFPSGRRQYASLQCL